MASFFLSLLVAHILVAFADPGQTLQGGRKSSGAVPKPSAQNRLSLVGGVGQATQAQRRVRPSAQPDNPVQPEASRSKQLQLRLELIKERILKKLHMDHEPKNITRHNVNLPEPLANLEDYDIEDYEDRPQHARKNSQVIVMTEQGMSKFIAKPPCPQECALVTSSLAFVCRLFSVQNCKSITEVIPDWKRLMFARKGVFMDLYWEQARAFKMTPGCLAVSMHAAFGIIGAFFLGALQRPKIIGPVAKSFILRKRTSWTEPERHQ